MPVPAAEQAASPGELEDATFWFEENRGQFGTRASYGTTLGETRVRFEPDAVEFSKATDDEAVVRMHFLGGRAPRLEGTGPLPTTVHYYLGMDPMGWIEGVPTFREIVYRGVYPGIDVVFYPSSTGQLEYDFVVAPGVSASVIGIEFENAHVAIEDGMLVVDGGGFELLQLAPMAYQGSSNKRTILPAAYQLAEEGVVRVVVLGRDEQAPLVIDPVISIVGVAPPARDLALGPDESIYVIGHLLGSDVSVTRLTRDGHTVLYQTYLGGAKEDYGLGVAVDDSGRAFITGYTSSWDFPHLNQFQLHTNRSYDAFASGLAVDGKLLYSTFLGGIDSDKGLDVATMPDGVHVVAGTTHSTDFPVVGAYQESTGGAADWFLTRISPSGTVMSSTFLGGAEEESRYGGHESIVIAMGPDGSLFLAGDTRSTDLPISGGFQTTNRGYDDVYLAKFTPGIDALLFSTYYGGSNLDYPYGLAIDEQGAAYITGWTHSTNLPLKNPYQDWIGNTLDAFVAKVAPDGGSLVYSTYLGGTTGKPGTGAYFGADYGVDITVDDDGSVIVLGDTFSEDLRHECAFQTSLGNTQDIFIAVLDAEGDGLHYLTYLGGATHREWGTAGGLRNDGSYVFTGVTASSDFPDLSLPLASYDPFLAVISPDGLPDTTAPVITKTASGVIGGGGWWRSPVEIRINATDSTSTEGCSGTDGVAYAVDGGGWLASRRGLVSGDGLHPTRVRAVDHAGNEQFLDFDVPIDATPPIVGIRDPSPGSLYVLDEEVALDQPLPSTVIVGDKTVRFDAADAMSGVDVVELWVDGTYVGSDNTPPYEVLWLSGDEEAGEHLLRATAFDVARNQASATMTVTTVPTTLKGAFATAADTREDLRRTILGVPCVVQIGNSCQQFRNFVNGLPIWSVPLTSPV